jgi:hypothetical protein
MHASCNAKLAAATARGSFHMQRWSVGPGEFLLSENTVVCVFVLLKTAAGARIQQVVSIQMTSFIFLCLGHVN